MTHLLPFRKRRKRLDLGVLYAEHAGLVYRRVHRFFSDPAQAEEVVHEIFLRALEKADSFRADASPTTWLYQLTTNYCLNRRRNMKRRTDALALNNDLAWLRPNAETQADVALLLEQVWASLDDESALIATYYFVDDMTHAQIAELTGHSRRTIGNRINALQAAARQAVGDAP